MEKKMIAELQQELKNTHSPVMEAELAMHTVRNEYEYEYNNNNNKYENNNI